MDETRANSATLRAFGHPLRPAMRDRATRPAQAWKSAPRPSRTFINPEVCEGCGDCGRVSNCMAIEPLETEFGRKRRINQSSCNKDFSCVEGFCPFVTVHGGRLGKPEAAAPLSHYLPPVPDPVLADIGERFSVLVAGIGGSGVVPTISQTIAIAAYLNETLQLQSRSDGLKPEIWSGDRTCAHRAQTDALHATRIAAGEADALIGCDLIVTAGDESLSKLKRDRTSAVISADLTPTADFARNPDWNLDADLLIERLKNALGDKALIFDAQRLATALLGDPIASNMFMLGTAWQRGLLPIRREAIDRAIELNGVAIDANKQAFEWGRRAAHDLASVETLVGFETRWTGRRRSTRSSIVASRTSRTIATRPTRRGTRVRRARARGEKRWPRRGADHGRRARLLQTARRQRRVGGRAALRGARVPAGFGARVEGSYRLHFHIGAWPFARLDPADRA